MLYLPLQHHLVKRPIVDICGYAFYCLGIEPLIRLAQWRRMPGQSTPTAEFHIDRDDLFGHGDLDWPYSFHQRKMAHQNHHAATSSDLYGIDSAEQHSANAICCHSPVNQDHGLKYALMAKLLRSWPHPHFL